MLSAGFKRRVRVVASVAVGLYAVAFVVFNAGHHADVWLAPFVISRGVPTLVVIVVTAVVSVSMGRLLWQLWRRGAR